MRHASLNFIPVIFSDLRGSCTSEVLDSLKAANGVTHVSASHWEGNREVSKKGSWSLGSSWSFFTFSQTRGIEVLDICESIDRFTRSNPSIVKSKGAELRYSWVRASGSHRTKSVRFARHSQIECVVAKN